jgi:hypothetical protein
MLLKIADEQLRTFKCDLCGAQFRNEEELAGHVTQY